MTEPEEVNPTPDHPSVAEQYHEHTKYSLESISMLPSPDFASKPPVFKNYLSDKSIDLMPYLKGVQSRSSKDSTSKDLASPDPGTADLSEEQASIARISRLLFHTGGITGKIETEAGTQFFRASPSAGALYPTEVYLASQDAIGLPDGIHYYAVRSHELIPLWEGRFKTEFNRYCLREPSLKSSKMWIILSGIFKRSSWRYHERAYRRILLDTGHLLGNLVSYASEEGLVANPIASFHDDAINDLMFFDRDEEVSLVVVPLQEASEDFSEHVQAPFPFTVPDESPPQTGAEAKQLSTRVNPEDDLMRTLHRHSSLEPNTEKKTESPKYPALQNSIKETRDASGPVVLRSSSKLTICDLPRVIRERRSTRQFDRTSLALREVSGILKDAYAPVANYRSSDPCSGRASFPYIDPTLISTYLVVLRVDGMPPGIYQYDEVEGSFHLRKEGQFELELWRLCLDQQLGRDCGAAIIHTSDLTQAVDRYGDRAYRYIHLDAGHIGQRINIGAISVGLGVSGIGGFFDEDINNLLDLPQNQITAYITLLGSPSH